MPEGMSDANVKQSVPFFRRDDGTRWTSNGTLGLGVSVMFISRRAS